MFPVIRTIVLSVLTGLASLSHAAPLSFTTALDLAERQSPKLAANAAAIAATRAAAIPAGALPDPRLLAGIDNFPISGPAAGRLQADFMTMQRIGVMQELPHAEKRRARQGVAAAAIDVANAQQRIDRLGVRRDTALAWLDLYYFQRKVSLIDDLEHENALLAQVVLSQIASGRAQAADAVAPKQEAAQLADRRDDLSRDLAQASAKLRQLVGLSTIDGLAGDPPALAIDAQHLRGHLQRHPELLAFSAESRRAEAEVAEARSLKKVDWGVELVYQRRAPQFGDMVSVQFTFDLPVSPATRQDPVVAAKRRELERLDALRERLVRDHTVELEGLLAEHAALTRQLERARQTALPLAEQKVSLQTASYQAGKVDLSAVLAARRDRIEQRLRVVELEGGRARVAARLHYAYGEDEP